MKKHLFTTAIALVFAAAAHAEPCDTTVDHIDATPLLFSAREGDVQNLRCLLDAGANVNEANEYGITTLMLAALEGNADAVRLLLERGANVNAASNDGRTALTMAAAAWGGQHTESARFLVEKGANLNARTQKGRTALLEAASRGRTDTVRLLIEKGADVNVTDNDGEIALMLAASHADAEAVRLMLEAGANVNTTDKDGKTALIRAAASSGSYGVASTGVIATIRALLAKGANINAADKDGTTALMYAASAASTNTFRNVAVVSALLDMGANINATDKDGATALIHAARKGRTEAVRMLLRRGADATITMKTGGRDTALSLATKHGHTESARALKEGGNDTQAAFPDPGDELRHAAGTGYLQEVQRLLDAGVPVDTRSQTRTGKIMDSLTITVHGGSTPLMEAASWGQADVAQLLIARGADVNASDDVGNTPLRLAADHSNTVQVLLKAGADPNRASKKATPLSAAAESGAEAVVRMLLDAGARIDTPAPEDGRTALMLAAIHDHRRIVKLLLARGADLNAKDLWGHTALELAADRGHKKIVRLLKKAEQQESGSPNAAGAKE